MTVDNKFKKCQKRGAVYFIMPSSKEIGQLLSAVLQFVI
jgi:hypothetical protein